jgi:hypothetical protein
LGRWRASSCLREALGFRREGLPLRILVILAFLFATAAPLAAQPAAPPIVAEAQAFMTDYATALLHGDRAGIAGRYDRSGAFFLGNGRKRFETQAQLAAHYADAGWQPPYRFEWRDLSYEPAGPDAVVVAGQFVWTPREDAQPFTFS